MPRFAAVSRHHVISALDEYDDLGQEEFLSSYGFHQSREYVLLHGGKVYDSKAILGVAHKYATGSPARSDEFSGGKDQAARILRELGFRVTAGDDPEAVVPVTGAWRETSDVGAEASREAWTAAARETLLEAAHRYRATVSPKELAIEAQRRSGVRTKQQMHYWLGEVLGRVALESARRDEPLLVSLCVDEDGRVGEGYAVAVLAAYGEKPDNPNAHAAKEQLECYRFFDALGLPADGGSVAPPKPVTVRTTTTRRAAAPKAPPVKRPTKPADLPREICPTCFMAIPRSGVCDNCG